mgnify:CR=1 FL=1
MVRDIPHRHDPLLVLVQIAAIFCGRSPAPRERDCPKRTATFGEEAEAREIYCHYHDNQYSRSDPIAVPDPVD